jgi:hypothetical protein
VRDKRIWLTPMTILLTLAGCAAPSGSGAPSGSASTFPFPSVIRPGSSSPLPALTGWRVIEVANPGFVASVAESDKGWVAVGAGEAGKAAIWRSDDGEGWEPVASLPTPAGPLGRVVAGGPGFIASGNTADVDVGAPFVWTSADGSSWSAVALPGAEEGGSILGILSRPGQVLLAGLSGPPDTSQAAVWISPDSTNWTRLLLGGDFADRPVVVGDRLVMVGGAREPRRGRVWTSDDGATWNAGEDPPELAGAYLWGLELIGGKLVASGANWNEETSHGTPAIFTSPDGAAWTLAFDGPCCGIIQALGAAGNGAWGFSLTESGKTLVYQVTGGSWTLAGTIDGFDGDAWRVAQTTTLGLVVTGRTADGVGVILVPPGS